MRAVLQNKLQRKSFGNDFRFKHINERPVLQDNLMINANEFSAKIFLQGILIDNSFELKRIDVIIISVISLYSLALSLQSCHSQLFVKQANNPSGIHPSAATISTPKILSSPTALPPSPSIMNINVVDTIERYVKSEQPGNDGTLDIEHQQNVLPEASALSSYKSEVSSNETISSLSVTESLGAQKFITASPYEGKLQRDQPSKSSKITGKNNRSNNKGI